MDNYYFVSMFFDFLIFDESRKIQENHFLFFIKILQIEPIDKFYQICYKAYVVKSDNFRNGSKKKTSISMN